VDRPPLVGLSSIYDAPPRCRWDGPTFRSLRRPVGQTPLIGRSGPLPVVKFPLDLSAFYLLSLLSSCLFFFVSERSRRTVPIVTSFLPAPVPGAGLLCPRPLECARALERGAASILIVPAGRLPPLPIRMYERGAFFGAGFSPPRVLSVITNREVAFPFSELGFNAINL